MRAWVIEIGEPIPAIDRGERAWRAGMLAETLAARGHTVTWWASTFNHARKTHRFPAFQAVDAGPSLQIRCLPGPGYRSNRSLMRIAHHLALARAFSRDASRQPAPAIVFCCLPSLEMADEAVKFGRHAGVPVVIDVRDLWPDHYLTLVPAWARSLARAALVTEYRRVRRLTSRATALTAIAESYLQWALARAGRSRRDGDGVFAMGYPSPTPELLASAAARRAELERQYGLEPDDCVVTFVGSFVSSFDLGTVIDAARALTGERFRFVLAGDGGEGPALRARAAGLNNVVFTGWCDAVSIRALLERSSAGLAPYRADALMSLPNKPFEYMSAGLPIISSLRGELEALLAQEAIGLHYRAGDAASLVAALRSLAGDRAAREAMAARSRALFDSRFRSSVVYTALAEHLERIGAAGARR